MTGLHIALIAATFLVAIVAGFVFAFAVVAMPGIRGLEDRDFIRAFQVMDGVIQRNQPIFMLVWLGSVVALGAAMGIGVPRLEGADQLLLLIAGGAYLGGVQLPTAAINVPLNNTLQKVDVDVMDDAGLRGARLAFEARWNRWNSIRTGFACVAAALLMVLLARV